MSEYKARSSRKRKIVRKEDEDEEKEPNKHQEIKDTESKHHKHENDKDVSDEHDNDHEEDGDKDDVQPPARKRRRIFTEDDVLKAQRQMENAVVVRLTNPDAKDLTAEQIAAIMASIIGRDSSARVIRRLIEFFHRHHKEVEKKQREEMSE